MNDIMRYTCSSRLPHMSYECAPIDMTQDEGGTGRFSVETLTRPRKHTESLPSLEPRPQYKTEEEKECSENRDEIAHEV